MENEIEEEEEEQGRSSVMVEHAPGDLKEDRMYLSWCVDTELTEVNKMKKKMLCGHEAETASSTYFFFTFWFVVYL